MRAANLILDILVGVAALAVAITVGRDNIKKRTIQELQDLVEALERKIDSLEETVEKFREENAELKETINGYTKLVREGYLSGFGGHGSGNRPASAKATKNRTP